jgi:hypothetical protein
MLIRCVIGGRRSRIEMLPKEAGWALITAGVVGVIAPGIESVNGFDDAANAGHGDRLRG